MQPIRRRQRVPGAFRSPDALEVRVVPAAFGEAHPALAATHPLAEAHIFPVPTDVASGGPQSIAPNGALAPLADTFRLHSLAGAAKTIYLDFNGHLTRDRYWNNGAGVATPAFSLDSNAAFSDTELQRVQYIWQRVVEDFAPFAVNVTTEDPGLEALRKAGVGDAAWGVRVVIGGDSNWLGSSAGGVAYVGSFGWTTDTPAFVFADELADNEKWVADAITHEVGHTLGLDHDGRTSPAEEYYEGHGAGAVRWAPIMGVAYDAPVGHWSRGEYNAASNTEDDLQIITTANGFGYRVDDHGNSLEAAASMTATEGESTVALSASGVIERNADADWFRFEAGAGAVNLTFTASGRGPNLDIRADLYNAAGALVASSNPGGALHASISAAVSAGTHYARVTGAGEGASPTTGYSAYGSLGQYTISGSAPRGPTTDATPPSAPIILAMSDDTGASAADRVTTDGAPVFTWSAATDAGGVAGYWWSLNDATPESGGTFTTDLSATTSVSAQGRHVFYARAQDQAGNLSAVSSWGFTFDTVRPRVTSITPADGSTVSVGPRQIVVRFSENMDPVSANHLSPSDLTLAGEGVGSAAATGAVWLDAKTAAFTIGGSWLTGQVRVLLTGAAPRDLAGNSVAAYTTGDFTIPVVDDHGDSALAATSVNMGQTLTGNIGVGGDADWFKFQATAGYSYRFQTHLTTLADSVLELYNRDGLTRLAMNDDVSYPDVLSSNLVWKAPATGEYYVKVRGYDTQTRGQYTLQAHAVVETATRVDVHGGAGDDALAFIHGASRAVAVNGAVTVLSSNITPVYFLGGAGRDRWNVLGTPGDDSATLRRGNATFATPTYNLYALQFEDVAIDAGGGANDRATLYDTSAADVFTARPDEATLAGSGYAHQVLGFDRVDALATAGGVDTAHLYDSAGDDLFLGAGTYAYLRGAAFHNQASRFEQVHAYAGGGDDLAQFVDIALGSAVSLVGDTASLKRVGSTQRAYDFDTVSPVPAPVAARAASLSNLWNAHPGSARCFAAAIDWLLARWDDNGVRFGRKGRVVWG